MRRLAFVLLALLVLVNVFGFANWFIDRGGSARGKGSRGGAVEDGVQARN